MSDNFEFDDDDDILFNAICIPVNENTTPTKSFKDQNIENTSLKRRKLDDTEDSLSPVFQISRKITNKTIEKNNFPKSNTPVKRIFPGPAGILSDENVTITSSQMEIYSQNTSSSFEDTEWKKMSKDFKINSTSHLYDKFNIAWIKKKATVNEFAIQKAPFLAAILLLIELSDGQQKFVNVTLKDMTGTIQGNILRSLYEDYACHFTLGSVLILVQFGVLSCTCDKCHNHHLTITPKNLSAIYSGEAKIVINKIEPQKILTDFYQQKMELALTKRNNANSSSARPSIIANKKAANTNAISSYTAPQKRSVEDSFVLPKLRSMPEDSTENKLNSSTVKDDMVNKSSNKLSNVPRKLFTFRKLPSEVSSSPRDTLESKIHCSSSPSSSNIKSSFSLTEIVLPSSLNNSQQKANSGEIVLLPKNIGVCEDTVEFGLNAPFVNEVNINNSGSETCSNKPKTLFTCKKVFSMPEISHNNPLPKKSNSFTFTSKSIVNSNNLNETVGNHRLGNTIESAGSQISVTVDSAEHETLWKTALDDVDLNSLFDDDF